MDEPVYRIDKKQNRKMLMWFLIALFIAILPWFLIAQDQREEKACENSRAEKAPVRSCPHAASVFSL